MAAREHGGRVDAYEEVTASIVAALESGTVPWRKPWRFSGDANAHRNAISRRPYRGVNVWLLDIAASVHGYERPYWLTFKQAKDAGGNVRKGEKSTLVVVWKMLQVKDETARDGVRTIPMLRHFRVFNVAQCDGLEVPELPERPPFDPIESAQRIIDGMPSAPRITYGGDRACYVPPFDEVRLPRPEDFTSREGFYATALHELVHSTGHESRLARPELKDAHAFGDDAYSREELTAEMGAAMLCGVAGIAPATIENSAAYIAGWLQALTNDRKLVVTAAGKAQRAADFILGAGPDDD